MSSVREKNTPAGGFGFKVEPTTAVRQTGFPDADETFHHRTHSTLTDRNSFEDHNKESVFMREIKCEYCIYSELSALGIKLPELSLSEFSFIFSLRC